MFCSKFLYQTIWNYTTELTVLHTRSKEVRKCDKLLQDRHFEITFQFSNAVLHSTYVPFNLFETKVNKYKCIFFLPVWLNKLSQKWRPDYRISCFLCVPFNLPKFNLDVLSFIRMEKKKCVITKNVSVALRKYLDMTKQQKVLTPNLQLSKLPIKIIHCSQYTTSISTYVKRSQIERGQLKDITFLYNVFPSFQQIPCYA